MNVHQIIRVRNQDVPICARLYVYRDEQFVPFDRADLKKKKKIRFHCRKSGRELTEEGPRGGRFHATSPLITSCAVNDETTTYYFTDCFRLGDHPRPSGSNTLHT